MNIVRVWSTEGLQATTLEQKARVLVKLSFRKLRDPKLTEQINWLVSIYIMAILAFNDLITGTTNIHLPKSVSVEIMIQVQFNQPN